MRANQAVTRPKNLAEKKTMDIAERAKYLGTTAETIGKNGNVDCYNLIRSNLGDYSVYNYIYDEIFKQALACGRHLAITMWNNDLGRSEVIRSIPNLIIEMIQAGKLREIKNLIDFGLFVTDNYRNVIEELLKLQQKSKFEECDLYRYLYVGFRCTKCITVTDIDLVFTLPWKPVYFLNLLIYTKYSLTLEVSQAILPRLLKLQNQPDQDLYCGYESVYEKLMNYAKLIASKDDFSCSALTK